MKRLMLLLMLLSVPAAAQTLQPAVQSGPMTFQFQSQPATPPSGTSTLYPDTTCLCFQWWNGTIWASLVGTGTSPTFTDLISTGTVYAGAQSGGVDLRSWNGQIAKINQGTNAQAVIALIGDSWTSGQLYTLQLTTYLQSRFGNAGPGYVNINPGAALASVTSTVTGTWADDTSIGAANLWAHSTDIATPGQWAVTATVTDLVLSYLKQPNGGSFRWQVDSGGWTTVATAAASNALGTVTINSLSPGSHTFTLQVTVAGSAGVGIMGLDCQNTVAGVRVHNLGYSGTQTQDWLVQNTALWESEIAALVPNTVGILLGVNDASGGIVPATYAANLATLIAQIRVAVPLADIVLIAPGDIGLVTTYPMSAYVAVLQAQAQASGVAFINGYQLLGSYTTANSRGLYSNTSHVNTSGGGVIANSLMSFLGGSSPLTGLTLSFAAGSAAAPAITGPLSDAGLYFAGTSTAESVYIGVNGAGVVRVNGSAHNILMTNMWPHCWSSDLSTAGTCLYSDATYQLGLRTGTNPSLFSIYNTYTSGTSFERLELGINAAGQGANIFGVVATQGSGGGSARPLYIGTTGNTAITFFTNNNAGAHWTLDVNGNFTDQGSHTLTAGAYKVGATAGVSCTITGATGHLTVVNGLVTLCN